MEVGLGTKHLLVVPTDFWSDSSLKKVVEGPTRGDQDPWSLKLPESCMKERGVCQIRSLKYW